MWESMWVVMRCCIDPPQRRNGPPSPRPTLSFFLFVLHKKPSDFVNYWPLQLQTEVAFCHPRHLLLRMGWDLFFCSALLCENLRDRCIESICVSCSFLCCRSGMICFMGFPRKCYLSAVLAECVVASNHPISCWWYEAISHHLLHQYAQ